MRERGRREVRIKSRVERREEKEVREAVICESVRENEVAFGYWIWQ